MDKLSKNELMNTKGGGWGIALAIGAGVIFLIGVIDGYINPKACNC